MSKQTDTYFVCRVVRSIKLVTYFIPILLLGMLLGQRSGMLTANKAHHHGDRLSPTAVWQACIGLSLLARLLAVHLAGVNNAKAHAATTARRLEAGLVAPFGHHNYTKSAS